MAETTGASTEHERSESPTFRATNELREKGAEAADQVARKAGDVADQAKQQAQEFTDEQMRVGAEQMQRVSSAIGKAAEELGSSSPLLAHYARSVASGLSGTAEQLRHRRSGDVLRSISDYASREPVAFLGAAVIAGFALSRFLKSSGEESTKSGRERQAD